MDRDRPRQPISSHAPTNIDGIVLPKSNHVVYKPGSLSQTPASNSNIAAMPRKRVVNHSPNNSIKKPESSLHQAITGMSVPKVEKKSQRLRKNGTKKWSRRRKIITSVLLVLILAAGAAGWDGWQLYHKLNHINVNGLSSALKGGAEDGSENILVAGSTNRCNLTVQNAQWGFCSQGVTGINSDIIFIVHIVPKTNTVSLLSIPRDTFVPNARSGDQAFKIDAALYQGPSQLVSAVEEDFGIPIQHYAEVGFDGFVNIVNAVGGIKMDFPMPVYDSESYLNIKTPGCKLLNGVEALQVVRARHLQYDPPGLSTSDVNLWPQEAESDIARIARTHEFLRVLASTVESQGLGNPITDQKLVDAIAPQVQVDSGLSTSDMLGLMETFKSTNINNVAQYTLPISTTTFGDYIYGGTDFGDVVFPAEPNDQQIINKFLGVSNTIDTMTGKALPADSSFKVNVLNGSGIPDQATQTTTSLQALGFNVVGQPGTSIPKSSEAQETVVNYAGARTEGDAEAVARELNGPVILSENAGLVTSGSNVTVITGTGLSVNAPASSSGSATSASTPATQATTAPSSTTAATVLEPASSSNQALSAWDPRACTE